MKTMVTTAAALALVAGFSIPAVAQQAKETATGHGGGQCAFSQAMLAAMAEGKQQQMEETKSKIDLLIENALASSRAARLAQSPMATDKGAPGG